MTFWRISTAARSVRVAIEGAYSGESAFLVGGSPKLLQLDLRLLKLPGCWSMAINNASVIIEPNAMIAVDTSKCFNANIFSNSRVLKLFTYSRHSEIISGKRLCLYPNTLFFDVQDETQLMMSEFCRLDGPLPFWRVTFFTALACLYQLGFKEVYLLGCTFDTQGYAHGQEIRESDKTFNDEVHDETVKYLTALMPMLRDEGMLVKTCHENTALTGIVDYISFYDAVSCVVSKSTNVEFGPLRHKSEFEK